MYGEARLAGFRAKLGLTTARDEDALLVEELLEGMEAQRADFTGTFRGLCEAAAGEDARVRGMFADAAALDAWGVRWRARLRLESGAAEERAAAMRAVNPAVIPRNHFVANVIAAAVERGDFAPFEELVRVTARPFEDVPEFAKYRVPARPEECVHETFCGT